MNQNNNTNETEKTEVEAQPDSATVMLEVPPELHGSRLDQALAGLADQYSRSRLQQWIKQGLVQVDGQQFRAKDKVKAGQQISLTATQCSEVAWQAEAIELDIVFEDDALLVINKPAGMVVHPAAGNSGGTLLNALLHHAPELEKVPRAGIVHRLDKDTSGILVVARTIETHKRLVDQLQARLFAREYIAVVNGVMTAGGTVDAPMARHPQQRTKMAVVNNGKPAVTHYRVAQRFRAHSLLNVKLETGRTHQIRVHMAHIRHSLLGDPVYAGRLKMPAGCSAALMDVLHTFKRQALHAQALGLSHPHSDEFMQWQVPLPDDMQHLIAVLTEDAKHE